MGLGQSGARGLSVQSHVTQDNVVVCVNVLLLCLVALIVQGVILIVSLVFPSTVPVCEQFVTVNDSFIALKLVLR